MASAVDREFTDRERVLSLAAVISTSFGVGMAFGIGFPLTALTFEIWHQPKWVIGLAGAAPSVAILIALPLLSRLITRYGPVPAIVSGCVAGAFGFLALWMFANPWVWIAVRLLMSAGFALPWLAGETWINSVARENQRGRVIALYAISYFLGYAVGPFLLETTGVEGLLPFISAAILTALSCLPIYVGRHLAPTFRDEGQKDIVSAFRLAPAAMMGSFIGGFAEITNLSLIPNVALAAGWSQDAALGLLSTLIAGGVALQMPIGWLSDKMRRIDLVVALGVAFIALIFVLPWVLGNYVAASIVVFSLGGVVLGFYSLGLAIVGERVSAIDLPAANVAFIVTYQGGALLGPIASGIAMTTSPILGFVTTMIVLMAVSGAVVMLLDRRDHVGR